MDPLQGARSKEVRVPHGLDHLSRCRVIDAAEVRRLFSSMRVLMELRAEIFDFLRREKASRRVHSAQALF